MDEATDHELLAKFAETGCEESFAALVQRHIHLVYSAAFRNAGSQDQAREITQAVFVLLARKASALGAATVIPGWLIPGRTVVFFETSRLGWNQAGGPELLPKDGSSIAVAFADGSASIVSSSEAAQLQWNP